MRALALLASFGVVAFACSSYGDDVTKDDVPDAGTDAASSSGANVSDGGAEKETGTRLPDDGNDAGNEAGPLTGVPTDPPPLGTSCMRSRAPAKCWDFENGKVPSDVVMSEAALTIAAGSSSSFALDIQTQPGSGAYGNLRLDLAPNTKHVAVSWELLIDGKISDKTSLFVLNLAANDNKSCTILARFAAPNSIAILQPCKTSAGTSSQNLFSLQVPSAALAGAWAGLLLDIDLPDVRFAIRTANGVASQIGRFDSAMPTPTEVLGVGAVDTFSSADGSHVRIDNVAIYLP